MIKSIIIIYIIYLNYLYAGIGDAMNKYWNDISNSNNNSAVGDQRAGYYSGGSYRARVPIVKHNLVDFAPPRFSAGCNGIDMFMGSFSHINTDQFIQLAKAIPANAIGYAFKLALKTLSPAIESTMADLQSVIDQINATNKSSCEAAMTLVDNAVEKNKKSIN